nr:AI-2E family transporter [uncultured Rhodopila sp.]
MPDESGRPGDTQATDIAARVTLIERCILVLLVVGLFIGVLAIMRPFTTAILFGAAVATAAWPARQALHRRGIPRRTAAAILLSLSLILIVVPTLIVAPRLADHLTGGIQRIETYLAATPEEPAWIKTVPLIGGRLDAAWDGIVGAEGSLRKVAEPYTGDLEQVMIGTAHALADSVLQVILSLAIATMFWANGDALVLILHDALRRLGGPLAEQALDVAAGAIRGVAYGVIGTALIQAVLLGAGLALAGVPGAGMLAFVGLLLAISQIGGPLLIIIWGGAAWWLFRGDHQAWGAFMIIWGVFVSTIDNFIKPFLIGFGIHMPISLTILGVFGGFIVFGFLGLFIGPTLIAVMFTLLTAWRVAVADHPAVQPAKRPA